MRALFFTKWGLFHVFLKFLMGKEESIRVQTEEARTAIPQPPAQKSQSQKANQNDHIDHSLV